MYLTNSIDVDFAIFMLMTGYIIPMILISSQQSNHVGGVELAIVVYCFISLRLLARHVSISQIVYAPLSKFASAISKSSGLEGKTKLITYILLAITFVSLLLTAIFSAQSSNSSVSSRVQSCFGILVILGLGYLFSRDR